MQHPNIRVGYNRAIPVGNCSARQLRHARSHAIERIADAKAIPWPALAEAWQRDLDAIDAEMARREAVS